MAYLPRCCTQLTNEGLVNVGAGHGGARSVQGETVGAAWRGQMSATEAT